MEKRVSPLLKKKKLAPCGRSTALRRKENTVENENHEEEIQEKEFEENVTEKKEKKKKLREEKNSTLDVTLGVLFIALTIAFGIYGTIKEFPGAWLATLLLLILEGIVIRFKKVKVGFRAQYLFLGKRVEYFVKEGLHIFLWPFFTIKEIDCRAITTPMDEENIFTSDNVEVRVENPSIVWKIVDLNSYQNLNPENLPGLLDDVVDQNVRKRIRKSTYAETLGMEFGLTKKTEVIHDLDIWGIAVLKIIVPDIIPINEDFIKAQELQTKEALEQKGQRIESRHHADLIKFFSGTGQLGGKGPDGPGLPIELANEAALIHMDKAEKKKLASSTFGLNADTVDAIVKAVTRR